MTRGGWWTPEISSGAMEKASDRDLKALFDEAVYR